MIGWRELVSDDVELAVGVKHWTGTGPGGSGMVDESIS